jgi:hypothetical protein
VGVGVAPTAGVNVSRAEKVVFDIPPRTFSCKSAESESCHHRIGTERSTSLELASHQQQGSQNTPSLIDAVLALAKQNRSPVTEEQLLRAFMFFYPDAVHVGFRPGVVDFFSTLRTFLDVGAGSPATCRRHGHLSGST